MYKSSTKAFWLLLGFSTVLHAVLYVAWFYTYDNNVSTISKKYAINISLSSEENITTSLNSNSLNIPHTKSHFVKKKLNQPLDVTAVNKNTKTTATHNKDNYKEFHKLLHAAINANKHYPLSALRLNREGTVKLSFQLFKNGEINSLKVADSSGYNMLDRAALKAVKSIQPFNPARQYIASVENFILNIKFQL